MLRVTTRFTGAQGSPWINMLNFSGLEDQAHADDAVAAVGAFWGAVDALMWDDVNWATDAEVDIVDVTTGNVEGVLTTTPQAGSGTALDSVPFAAQAVVRLRTGNFVAGTEVRGRIFVPAIGESHLANGALIGSAQTTIQTAAAALAADSAGLVVYSRTHQLVADVTSTSVWAQFAVLRSRRD